MEKTHLNEKVKKKVDGQNWVVIQMVGPGLRQKTNKSAIRILGAFEEQEEAKAYALEYSKLDERWDNYVMQMYEWAPMLNEVHEVGDVKYSEKEINDLLDVHESTKTQTEEWNNRVENAKKSGKDAWGLENL